MAQSNDSIAYVFGRSNTEITDTMIPRQTADSLVSNDSYAPNLHASKLRPVGLAGAIMEDVDAENRDSNLTIAVGVAKSREFSRAGTKKEEEMKGKRATERDDV